MRGNQLTTTQHERIIGAYLNGVKQITISVQLDIPASTVNDTIKRYKEKGSVIPAKRPGRPKKFSQHDKRALQRIIREDRFASLGSVTNQLNTKLNTSLHINTIRKYIHSDNIYSYVARRKPSLTKRHKKNRLKWCKE
jgi:transposase